MVIRSRVSQDHRGGSRVIARLDCRMEYNNASYDAVLVDLSSKGAFISSTCLPAADEDIKVYIKSKHLQKELTLTAKVLRGSEVMTDYGERGRFAVRFHESPLDLTVLIVKLSSE